MKKTTIGHLAAFAGIMVALSEEDKKVYIVDEPEPNFPSGAAPQKVIKFPDQLAFRDQYGVKETLKDAKIIIEGKSLKGKRKQAQVMAKVNDWIKKGFITSKDIDNV